MTRARLSRRAFHATEQDPYLRRAPVCEDSADELVTTRPTQRPRVPSQNTKCPAGSEPLRPPACPPPLPVRRRAPQPCSEIRTRLSASIPHRSQRAALPEV